MSKTPVSDSTKTAQVVVKSLIDDLIEEAVHSVTIDSCQYSKDSSNKKVAKQNVKKPDDDISSILFSETPTDF